MGKALPFNKTHPSTDSTQTFCDLDSVPTNVDPDHDESVADESVALRKRIEYPVEVIRSAKRHKTVSARIIDGVIRVRIPNWMSSEEEHRAVENIVKRVRRSVQSNRIDLQMRARSLAKKYGLPVPASIIWSKVQRQRWGSCSRDGHIRISDRLTELPGWVLDFVIIHELTHLVVHGHGPEFQALVNRYPLAERAYGYLMAINDQLRVAPDPQANNDRASGSGARIDSDWPDPESQPHPTTIQVSGTGTVDGPN